PTVRDSYLAGGAPNKPAIRVAACCCSDFNRARFARTHSRFVFLFLHFGHRSSRVSHAGQHSAALGGLAFLPLVASFTRSLFDRVRLRAIVAKINSSKSSS